MEKRKYAVFNSYYNSLTFLEDKAIYKNNQKTGIKTYYYINLEGSNRVPWEDKKEKIKSIKFETEVKPTHIKGWFNDMKNLIHIIYLNKLDTSLVNSMDSLFKNCKNLTSLDLSSFDTTNVVNMNNMFDGCNKLQTIKISKEKFNIDNVEQSENMFKDCYALKGEVKTEYNEENPKDKTFATIDYEENNTPGYFTNYLVSYASVKGTVLRIFKDIKNKYFNKQEREDEEIYYANIENLSAAAPPPWKEKNSNITEIEIDDIIKPFSTYSWFENTNTESIDISKINTIRLSNTSNMFKDCQNLISINIDKNDYDEVNTSSNMFLNCFNLVGKEGTIYNSAFVDKTYARIDEGEDWPGYFSGAGVVKNELYAVYDSSNNSLVFFRDVKEAYYDGEVIGTKTYYTNIEEREELPWGRVKTKTVQFKAPVKLKAVNYLFNETEDIINFEKLDTSEITDMSYMFYQCKIPSFDLSFLNTHSVVTMDHMFADCSFDSINISNFDTSKVTNMSYMFYNCVNLTSLDLSNFDTSKVTTMSNIFNNCSNLTSLNLDNFDLSNIEFIDNIFNNCYNLTTTIKIVKMPIEYDGMFYNAAKDSGEITLKYYDPVTREQAEILKATENEGNVVIKGEIAYAVYDSRNHKLTFFKDEEGKYYNGEVIETKTYYTGFEEDTQHRVPWVSKAGDIYEIEFENTIKPKSTAFWFQSMRELEQINNIEKLDTSEVTDMSFMFNDCALLSTFDLSSIDTSNVITMAGMFSACSILTNLNLESLDMSKTKDVRGLLMGCNFVTTTINITSMPENYANMLYDAANSYGQITLKYFSPVTRNDIQLLADTGSEDSNIIIERGDPASQVAYAIYDTNDYSLTFFKDEEDKYTDGQEIDSKIYYTGFEENEDIEYRPGWTHTNQIKSINGENKIIKPKITIGWFEGNDFDGNDIDLQSFDLSNVTSMESMFMDCQGLNSVNLGEQNAINLENTEQMFGNNQYDHSSEEPISNGLVSINMENFNAPNLKNISYMFYGCKDLESINMNWYQATSEDNPDNVSGVFYGCESLTTIGNKDFIIPTVTEGEYQGAVETFSYCYNLTVTIEYGDLARGDAYGRIYDAAKNSGLITIKYREPLIEALVRYDIFMHEGDCNFYVEGTFSTETEPETKVDTEAYAKYDTINKELIFFRDDRGKYNPEGEEIDNNIYYSQIEYYQDKNYYDYPAWHSYNEEITNIIFHDEIIPLSTKNWFEGANNLTSIENIENLKFKDVFEMNNMFYDCYNLNEGIDLNIYINNLNYELIYQAPPVFSMAQMFDNCEQIHGNIAFIKIDSELESSEYSYDDMFYNAALDLPLIITGENIEELENIVNTKTKNSNVYINEIPTPSIEQAYAYYNSRNNSLVFFRDGKDKYIDEESIENRIYFTNFEEKKVGYIIHWNNYDIKEVEFKNEIYPFITSGWFSGMDELLSIKNINLLNTSNVTDMSYMFANCQNLTSLDLSSFNFSNVTSIESMFSSCYNLANINFKINLTNPITNVGSLFYECAKINTDLIISKSFEELEGSSYILSEAATDEGAEIRLKYSGSVASEDIDQFIEDYVSEGQHIINGGHAQ